MSGIWDAAEMLMAMAGDTEAAVAAARGMAEDCAADRRPQESRYWHEVAWALTWLANPQPLIAPDPPPAPGAVVKAFRPRGAAAGQGAPGSGAKIHRLGRAGAKLPAKRTKILALKRRLRGVFEQHAAPARPPRGKPQAKDKPRAKDKPQPKDNR
ncbi:MAG: hypothetical protein KIT16_05590 [Rhodospirillaceae bacterium]|nr:hypothetical protein [Rhodospirillaceae bacterium]